MFFGSILTILGIYLERFIEKKIIFIQILHFFLIFYKSFEFLLSSSRFIYFFWSCRHFSEFIGLFIKKTYCIFIIFFIIVKHLETGGRLFSKHYTIFISFLHKVSPKVLCKIFLILQIFVEKYKNNIFLTINLAGVFEIVFFCNR